MTNYKTYGTKSWQILGAAFLAAAWMIGGPDILSKLNWHGKVIDLATWIPTIMVFFWSISGNNKFLACERRAFRRLLGR
ncbi:MAG: hypothetical protein L3J65_01915 [Robiginitomaculum sp.]|nr:hypothetical protein [Robiginitomaculum sp.]